MKNYNNTNQLGHYEILNHKLIIYGNKKMHILEDKLLQQQITEIIF